MVSVESADSESAEENSAEKAIVSASRKGRILFKGSPEELAVNPIVKEKYLGSNFVLQKKDFERMAEEKRRKEMEEGDEAAK